MDPHATHRPADPARPIRALVVVGTRPEAIKLAPVVRAMQRADAFEPLVAATGQHREMLAQMLGLLGAEPRHELAVMRDRQSLAGLTARLVEGLGEIVAAERPDVVVVRGDTTSAFCGALAAFYAHVPVGHVEAGLRTRVLTDPFPEELNRRLVGQIAQWHFAPTPLAAANLRAEGIRPGRILVTGNTVIDNLLWMLERGVGRSAFRSRGPRTRRVLVTLHRRENQGPVMAGIAGALGRLAARGDVELALPLHKSPAVRDCLLPALTGRAGVTLTEPLDYPDFAATLAGCDLVMTDSGGVQEEAPSLGKPVLVLRNTTERPEAVDAGVARLVGTRPEAAHDAVAELLDDPSAYAAMASPANPFGDGRAAGRILAQLGADLEPANGPGPAPAQPVAAARTAASVDHSAELVGSASSR